MRRAILAAALAPAVAACGTPAPQLRIRFAGSSSQACPSADCDRVPLPCDAVMSIRIIDPDDPTHAYLDQCTSVPPNLGYNACSLRGVDLEPMPIPVRDAEVQIAVFPRSALPAGENGDPVCPKDTQYSAADGYPVEQSPAPALGGSAFYHPGDEIVSVTLGCTNLSPAQAGAACTSTGTGSITATVDDFDTRLPVTSGPQGVARALYVWVGEPRSLDGQVVLGPLDTVPLHLDGGAPPTWSAAGSREFNQHACVEVLEDVAQATATLRCTPVPVAELKGTRLAKKTLDSVLGSLSLSEVPDEGLTIGIVVDTLLRPAPGYVVTPPVTYLSPGGVAGGTTTSTTGIFVSRDAPFGTTFSAAGANATVPAIGGLVAGKVTIVFVPLADPAQ